MTKFRPQAGRKDLVIIYLRDLTDDPQRWSARLTVKVELHVTVANAFRIANELLNGVIDKIIDPSDEDEDKMQLYRDHETAVLLATYQTA